MKLFVFILCQFTVLLTFAQCPVLPSPNVYKVMDQGGVFSFNHELKIDSSGLPKKSKQFLENWFAQFAGIQIHFTQQNADLVFSKLQNVPPHYYSINVNDQIRIQYSSEESCFYAINSLCQLIVKNEDESYILKSFVSDLPNFEWRGIHLDVSRHFFTTTELKKMIDLLAFYKFNKFHLHLTDDQGWRIEIKKYPKLTSIGGFRDSTVIGHYTDQPRKYEVKRYGGFYTQNDLKDLVQYALDRYITIVPEIEMPGHSRALLAAYPTMSCHTEVKNVPGLWGVYEEVLCTKKGTLKMMKHILDEVMEIFPSNYIHIGGDEVMKNQWRICSKCQKTIKKKNLKNEDELQSYFINEIGKYLQKKGRTMVGWDEILEGGLPKNAVVMSWRGFQGGIEAVKESHQVVMSPGEFCYFDHYQSNSPNEPIAIGGFTSLEKVFQFNPIPEGLSELEKGYILGAQGNLWTEYMRDFSQVEYMAFPRAIALAQVLWSKNKGSYEDFEGILKSKHLPLLDHWGVNYAKALYYPQVKFTPAQNGINMKIDAQTPQRFDVFIKSNEAFGSMNNGMTMVAGDTLYFERTTLDKTVDYRISISNETLKNPIVYHVRNHPALNLAVQLMTKPNKRFSGQNGFTLVDGIYGKLPWKGSDWLGFDTNDIRLSVDLNGGKMLSGFKLDCLLDASSWIHLPQEIEVWGMNQDGLNRILVIPYTREKIDINGNFETLIFRVKGKDKIEMGQPGEGKMPWIFMDELELYFKD